MSMLLVFLRFTTSSAYKLLGSALAHTCLPPIPPKNWNSALSPRNNEYPKSEAARHENAGHKKTRRFRHPEVKKPTPKIILHCPPSSPDASCHASLNEIDFTIYSDASSPQLNKAAYITPRRPTVLTTADINFSILRAASERVSEILKENRRRLDAGEDPNTARKEARKKRAQEISAARKQNTSWMQ